MGDTVQTAGDDKEAWALIPVQPHHLVGTDHRMIPRSELDLIRKIFKQGISLPVPLISRRMPAEDLHRQPWLRIRFALPKPYSRADLVSAVDLSLAEFPACSGS